MRINGIFNLFVGIGLTLGFYPLIFSALAILHLIGVIFTLGIFNNIAIRDIGLLILAIGIFLEEVRKSDKIELLIKRIFKKDFLKIVYEKYHI